MPLALSREDLEEDGELFQNDGVAPGGKQGLRWLSRAGGLAEPCPGPEMPLGHGHVPRASVGTDPVCYMDVWVPVCRLLGLSQVWFLFGLVALTCLCPQPRHPSLPPATQPVCSSLSWRFSLLGFPAPSGNWYKETPQLYVEFLNQGGLSVTKHAQAALLWRWAAELAKPVFSRFLLQRGSLGSGGVSSEVSCGRDMPLGDSLLSNRFVLALCPFSAAAHKLSSSIFF